MRYPTKASEKSTAELNKAVDESNGEFAFAELSGCARVPAPVLEVAHGVKAMRRRLALSKQFVQKNTGEPTCETASEVWPLLRPLNLEPAMEF